MSNTTATVRGTATTTLNVRSGPGTTYSIVSTVAAGTVLTGTISNGWMHVTAGSLAGRYVSAAYLNPSGSTAGTVTAWAMSDRQAPLIRSGPGFAYSVVGRTAVHQKLVGTLVGDWIKIGPSAYVNKGTTESLTSDVRSLNGNIATSRLCPVPLAYNTPHFFKPNYQPTTPRYLNCTALTSLNSLEAAYKARFGTWATIDLAYRSYAEQVYWYDRLGSPTAAFPGTSNHGYGVAIDFQEEYSYNDTFYWGHPGQVWLAQNAGKYGWNNDFAYGTPHESYHYDFIG